MADIACVHSDSAKDIPKGGDVFFIIKQQSKSCKMVNKPLFKNFLIA